MLRRMLHATYVCSLLNRVNRRRARRLRDCKAASAVRTNHSMRSHSRFCDLARTAQNRPLAVAASAEQICAALNHRRSLQAFFG